MDSQTSLGMEAETGGHVRKHMDNAASVEAIIEPGVQRDPYRQRAGNPIHHSHSATVAQSS